MPKVSHAGLLISFCELSVVWAPDNKTGSPRAGMLRQEGLTQASFINVGSSRHGQALRRGWSLAMKRRKPWPSPLLVEAICTEKGTLPDLES